MTTRPSISYAFWFFFLAAFLALVALFWSAVKAFELTMEPNHALLAAIAYETAAAADAVALARVRGWRDLPGPLAFTLILLVGSAVYNFAQVRSHAAQNGITDTWFLMVFALGPLVATISLAINAGRELLAYEVATEKWQKDTADRFADDRRRALQAQAAKEETARSDQLRKEREEREAREREAERNHQLQLARLQLANAAQSQRKADDGESATQGEAQPLEKIPQQPKPARGQSQAAARALRDKYPGHSNAEYAEALQVNPAQVTRAFKDNPNG